MKDIKNCPFCGEEVLEAAVKCKHCKSSLPSEENDVIEVVAPPKKDEIEKDEIEKEEVRGINLEFFLIFIPGLAGLFIKYWLTKMSLSESLEDIGFMIVYGVALLTSIVIAVEVFTSSIKSAGLKSFGWFFGVLLVWIVAFPLYCYKRKDYGYNNKVGMGAVAMFILLSAIYGIIPDDEIVDVKGQMDKNTKTVLLDELHNDKAVPKNADGTPDIDTMVASLQEKMEADPNNAKGWYMLGRSYMKMKHYPDAVNSYEKALKLKPESADIMLSLADSLAMVNQGNLSDRPAELINKALLREPSNMTALWLGGMVARQNGDYLLATERWKKVLPQLKDPQEIEEVNTLIAEAIKNINVSKLNNKKINVKNDEVMFSDQEIKENGLQWDVNDIEYR